MKKNERCVQNIDEKIPIPLTLIFCPISHLDQTKILRHKKAMFCGCNRMIKRHSLEYSCLTRFIPNKKFFLLKIPFGTIHSCNHKNEELLRSGWAEKGVLC